MGQEPPWRGLQGKLKEETMSGGHYPHSLIRDLLERRTKVTAKFLWNSRDNTSKICAMLPQFSFLQAIPLRGMNCKVPGDGCWKMGFLNFNELSKQTYCSRQMHTFPPPKVVGEWNPGVRQASWSENALNPRNQSSASKLLTKLVLFCLSLLFISPIKILLIPSVAYELAKSLLLNLSAETEEILLLLVNAAVQVFPADKVKKQLQTLVTIYEGHGWIFSSWVPETSSVIWVRI